MRAHFSMFITSLIAVTSCIILSGCTVIIKDDHAGSANNDSEIVSINIHETGGEDGRDIEWKVYSQDDKYLLSYSDHRKTYGEPSEGIFEITEQEYKNIMDLDYEKFIDEYDESFWKNVADAICFQSTITYRNSYEKTTNASMTEATVKLTELLYEYKNKQTSSNID